MDAARSSRQKSISARQEERVANETGGRVQAASGATKHGGADVIAPGYRFECKYTEKTSYTIQALDLRKLRGHAQRCLEQPVFQLDFVDRLGTHASFAFVQHGGGTPGMIVGKKSLSITMDGILRTLSRGDKFTIKFQGEPDCWICMHWQDFLKNRS